MIRKNRFQGDPAVKLTENGASMTFKGGQPIMDQGVHNSVLISLFTKPGWWGNSLMRKESQKIGSNFERQRTIIDIKTINETTDDATLALKWMKDTNLASKIDITVTNPNLNNLKTKILITPPSGTAAEFLLQKNGIRWIMQALNPASERL
jgi:phage gp46-like protein